MKAFTTSIKHFHMQIQIVVTVSWCLSVSFFRSFVKKQFLCALSVIFSSWLCLTQRNEQISFKRCLHEMKTPVYSERISVEIKAVLFYAEWVASWGQTFWIHMTSWMLWILCTANRLNFWNGTSNYTCNWAASIHF